MTANTGPWSNTSWRHGADPCIKDKKVNGTAAGWADHAGFAEIKDLLAKAESKDSSASG